MKVWIQKSLQQAILLPAVAAQLLFLAGCRGTPEHHALEVDSAPVDSVSVTQQDPSAPAAEIKAAETAFENSGEPEAAPVVEVQAAAPPEIEKPEPRPAISQETGSPATSPSSEKPPGASVPAAMPAEAGNAIGAPAPRPAIETKPQAKTESPAEVKPAPAQAAPGNPEEPAKPAQKSPTQAPPLDLDGLETRLRQTRAIGLFTKLELKGQVEDLVEEVDLYHRSKGSLSLAQLQEHFDLLVMKLLILVQDEDPVLSKEIATARPTLWTTLADPVQFSSIKGP